MNKEDLVLNNLQWLICHKTKHTHTHTHTHTQEAVYDTKLPSDGEAPI